MTYRNPPTIPMFLRQLADVLNIYAFCRVSKIEVHVDVGVELARHAKDALDLLARLRIDVGRDAHNRGSAHLEAVTPEMRARIMPGKSTVPVERYFDAFAAAVRSHRRRPWPRR